MSGVTDLAFRIMCRKFGAAHCFYEMVDANAITREHKRTADLLKTLDGDWPIAGQLVGESPEVMLDAAQRLAVSVKIAFLDINSACPAKKVVKKKAGAALLKDPKKLGAMVKALAQNLKIPVTVKLRIGFDKQDHKAFLNIAKTCEDNGASTVFIHGRTAAQAYAGDIDYEAIRLAKENLKIPVFGSGNILDAVSAKRMSDETGCDGILVARGALGNPWIFADIDEYIKKGTIAHCRSVADRKRVLKEHLMHIDKHKAIANFNKPGYMGKIATWYLKGFSHARRLRERIYKAKSCEKLIELVDSL